MFYGSSARKMSRQQQKSSLPLAERELIVPAVPANVHSEAGDNQQGSEDEIECC